MVAHSNEVMSRDALMRLCYPTAKPAFGRAIDIGVARLRRKLGTRADVSNLIRTVRNQGYVLSERVLAEDDNS